MKARVFRFVIHLVGFVCLVMGALEFAFERWPAQVSLRPAKVVGLNPGEKEMGALIVSDRSGHPISVSGSWDRVEHLRPGETVWVHDFHDRDGECTGEGTALAGPFFLREAALAGAFLYLGWLALIARRRWNRSEGSSAG